MSCFGQRYNPNPPREWYRYQTPCPSISPQINILDIVNPESNIPNRYKYELAVYKKGNILQYKKNSADITKAQRYSQIAKGMWTNRTKTWGSQGVLVSDPNTDLLKRVNYSTIVRTNYSVNGTEIVYPRLCSKPSPQVYPVLPPSGSDINPDLLTPLPPLPEIKGPDVPQDIMPPYEYKPTIIYPVEIQDGGTLLCNITANPCTGKILNQTYTRDCYPSSASDVPGPVTLLCWNDGLHTYYPKTKRTYGNSNNKWPINSKLIFSAN
jgi:hypothetical protein